MNESFLSWHLSDMILAIQFTLTQSCEFNIRFKVLILQNCPPSRHQPQIGWSGYPHFCPANCEFRFTRAAYKTQGSTLLTVTIYHKGYNSETAKWRCIGERMRRTHSFCAWRAGLPPPHLSVFTNLEAPLFLLESILFISYLSRKNSLAVQLIDIKS